MFAPLWSVRYAQIVNACDAVGFQPRIVEEARRAETVIALVSAGTGVALMPSTIQLLAMPAPTPRRLVQRLRDRCRR